MRVSSSKGSERSYHQTFVSILPHDKMGCMKHTSESGSKDLAMGASSSHFERSDTLCLARRASSSLCSCSSSSSMSSSCCCKTSSHCLYNAFSESTSSSALFS